MEWFLLYCLLDSSVCYLISYFNRQLFTVLTVTLLCLRPVPRFLTDGFLEKNYEHHPPNLNFFPNLTFSISHLPHAIKLHIEPCSTTGVILFELRAILSISRVILFPLPVCSLTADISYIQLSALYSTDIAFWNSSYI
jgi:hypothetical protein